MGQACQDLSQSRGMGKAPNQAPSTVNIHMRNSVEVRGDSAWLEYTESKEEMLGPSIRRTG